jgi:hypothetical protein
MSSYPIVLHIMNHLQRVLQCILSSHQTCKSKPDPGEREMKILIEYQLSSNTNPHQNAAKSDAMTVSNAVVHH